MITVELARDNLAQALSNLAEVLAEQCPGLHRYVQHRDMRPPWCESCGYTRTGEQVR